jgi:hypothetical protein
MKFINRRKSTDPSVAEVGASPIKPAPSAKAGKAKSGNSGGKSFTLLIGDEGAILVLMQGATVLRRLFAASAQMEHTAAFADLMRNNPRVPISLLMDVIDQQYSRHTFPPVSAMSIAGLVARRIERDFKPEDMKNALKLGRDKAGRKEWQYLIIALANTPHIQRWLDFILELPNRCRGIYLLPLEMQQIIPALMVNTKEAAALPWQLLISHNKVSGFRQVVLHNGNLVFTRVSQMIEDATPPVIAGSIEQEIISTLEYLRRMNLTDNKLLNLTVICAQELIDVLDLERFAAGSALAMAPIDAADSLGLQQAALSADRFGDVVVAGAFARMRKRTLPFSNVYLKKLKKLYDAQLAVRVVAALLIVGFLFAAGMSVVDMLDARETGSISKEKKLALQPQIAAANQAASSIGKNITYKSLIVAVHDHYLKDMLSPQDFVAQLTPLLPEDVRVKSFQWGAPGAFMPSGTSVNVAAASAPQVVKGALPLEIHVGMELNGVYTTVEEATQFADKLMADIKAAMPLYDVAAAPFPWVAAKQITQEITLDQPTVQSNVIANGKNKISLVFRGPKKLPASTQGAAPVREP